MRRKTAWLGVLVCLAASVVLGGERRAASFIPADAFVLLSYDGSNPAMEATTYHAFFQEPEVQAAAKQLRPLIDHIFAAITGGPGLDLGAAMRAAERIEIALGVVLPPGGKEKADAVVVFGVGTGDTPARQQADRLLKLLVDGAAPNSVKQLQIGDVQATSLKDGQGDPHCFAFDGPFLVIAEQEATLRRALDPAAPKIDASLGEERPVLRFRYDHAALVKAMGAEMDEEAAKALNGLGLGALRFVQLAVVPQGKRLVWKIEGDLTATQDRVGLAKWLADAPPFDPELLKLVPKDANLFLVSMVDVSSLWDEAWATIGRISPQAADEGRQGLAQLDAQLGMSLRNDLLALLDRGTAVVGDSEGGWMGGWVVVVQRVKDGKALETRITQLANRLDLFLMGMGRGMGAVRTELKSFTYRGTPCRYLWMMGTPALVLPGWAPCYADLGKEFAFSTHPLHLKSFLDFLADKKPTILENAEFQELQRAVPKAATCLSYGSLTETIVALYNTLAPIAMIVQGFGDEMGMEQPLDLANLPSSRLVRRYARGAIFYTAFENGRYRIQGEGDGLEFLGPHVVPVGATAVLAGMLLPALARARGEARLIRDRNNLNQIAKGCAIYLNEHGDNRFYPGSLAELVDKKILTPEVFVSPLDPNPPKLANGVPCSYVSVFEKYPTLQFRDDFPPNIILAWDREPFVPGRRSVLFFDSHVEVMAEPQFEAALRALDEQVKQAGLKEKKKPEQGGNL